MVLSFPYYYSDYYSDFPAGPARRIRGTTPPKEILDRPKITGPGAPGQEKPFDFRFSEGPGVLDRLGSHPAFERRAPGHQGPDNLQGSVLPARQNHRGQSPAVPG